MIGRAAQGRPWIFREVTHFLATGSHLPPPLVAEVRSLLLDHLNDHYFTATPEHALRANTSSGTRKRWLVVDSFANG